MKASKCSGCLFKLYTSKEQQKEDWSSHRQECEKTRQMTISHFAMLRDIFKKDESLTSKTLVAQLTEEQISYFSLVCYTGRHPNQVNETKPVTENFKKLWDMENIDYYGITMQYRSLRAASDDGKLDHITLKAVNEDRYAQAKAHGVPDKAEDTETIALDTRSLPSEPKNASDYHAQWIFKSSLSTWTLDQLRKMEKDDLYSSVADMDQISAIQDRLQGYIDSYRESYKNNCRQLLDKLVPAKKNQTALNDKLRQISEVNLRGNQDEARVILLEFNKHITSRLPPRFKNCIALYESDKELRHCLKCKDTYIAPEKMKGMLDSCSEFYSIQCNDTNEMVQVLEESYSLNRDLHARLKLLSKIITPPEMSPSPPIFV